MLAHFGHSALPRARPIAAAFALCGIWLATLPATAVSQPYRATLRLTWTADSAWEGSYFEKPHRFHVREEIDGRLVFDMPDAAGRDQSRAVHALQLREDGTAVGGSLVEAVGSSSYRSEVHKEGGSCAPPGDGAAAGRSDPPFDGRNEAAGAWDARAPGALLLVFKGDEPIGVAFSPKSLRVESSYRLLCAQPEAVRRSEVYRITARGGALVPRTAGDTVGGTEGRWTYTTARTPRGGYTATARYRLAVRQQRPAVGDSAAAIGQLEVTKTLVITWEIVE